jgi:hypothetical protein
LFISFGVIDEKEVIFLAEPIAKDESYRFKPVVRQDSYLAACKKPTIIGELVIISVPFDYCTHYYICIYL